MLIVKLSNLLKFLLFVNVLGSDENVTEQVIKTEEKGKMEGFIVGGYEATIDSYPHSVFLAAYCSPDDDQYWVCGASILNQRILLTAAHCVHGCRGKFHIDAIAGTTNVDYVNVMRKVYKYVNHGLYNPQTDYCDISVILLNGNLPLGNKIKRVLIRSSFAVGTAGEVAGWGVISDNNAESPYLKRVRQIVRPAKACGHIKLQPGMMCVSSSSTKEYPAVGDSGSALVTKGHQQIGIVSFKSRYKQINMIVYTNVSYFYNWIHHHSLRLWCG